MKWPSPHNQNFDILSFCTKVNSDYTESLGMKMYLMLGKFLLASSQRKMLRESQYIKPMPVFNL